MSTTANQEKSLHRAIKKHGLKKLILAFYEHRFQGEGGASMALNHGMHYNTMDAMINAGRTHVEKIKGFDAQLDYCKKVKAGLVFG